MQWKWDESLLCVCVFFSLLQLFSLTIQLILSLWIMRRRIKSARVHILCTRKSNWTRWTFRTISRARMEWEEKKLCDAYIYRNNLHAHTHIYYYMKLTTRNNIAWETSRVGPGTTQTSPSSRYTPTTIATKMMIYCRLNSGTDNTHEEAEKNAADRINAEPIDNNTNNSWAIHERRIWIFCVCVSVYERNKEDGRNRSPVIIHMFLCRHNKKTVCCFFASRIIFCDHTNIFSDCEKFIGKLKLCFAC